MATTYATDVSPIIVDIETTGLDNAADYLEPVQPAKNLVDPAKVKADIEKRTAERDEKLALDWNVGRIVYLGWWTESVGVVMRPCGGQIEETLALTEFWARASHRTIVGFNVRGFDLKFMVQRSRYLGIAYPDLDLGKYAKRGIEDLFSLLTFNEGTSDQGAMRRTLHAFCRRFGIPVDDTTTGKDIPALVAAGEWGAIADHCRSDIELTLALARRLGVIQPALAEAVL